MSAAGVGVVVVGHGTGGEAEGLLASLLAEGVSPESIVAVHNPSAPGELGPPLPPGCEPLRPPYNLGYAAGMNAGIGRQLARGVEFLLLVTHDVRLRPGALATLLRAAAAHPDYGVLGPALMVAGTDEPFSFGGLTRSDGSVTHVGERPAESEGAVVVRDWIDGSTMLIRAEVLERVGGFDERFWGYAEEADLCLRAGKAGYRVGVVTAAVADQTPGGRKRLGVWSYLITRNGAEYARRARGPVASARRLGQSLGLAVIGLLRAAARSARLRPGDPVEPWTESVGAFRGAFDFLRRHWGPPPTLRGMGDVTNIEPAGEVPARPRVLHMGPDAAIGGGMAVALRALLGSPLAERYELDVIATYRRPEPLRRLALYCVSLARLTFWRLRRRGKIVHIHATVRGSMYRKSVLTLVARSLGARVVLHVHSGPGDLEAFAARIGWPSRWLFGRAMRAADRVLAVSKASAAALAQALGAEGVAVVPNAAPTLAAVRSREGRQGPARALYLGGFANRAKGGDVLLEALDLAAAEGHPLCVVLAGPGQLPDAASSRFGPGTGVEWIGWLDQRERDAALSEADVFVLPSRSEGLPMALLEAMSSGLAIVATAVGGVPDVLEPERDALFVAAEDPPGLAAALVRLAGDPKLRAELSAAARGRAIELDATLVADRLESIYESLL